MESRLRVSEDDPLCESRWDYTNEFGLRKRIMLPECMR